MNWKRKSKALLLGLLITVSASVNLNANGNLANMEAIFIYNFLRLVNWPANSTNEVFTIGVYGNTATMSQLHKLANNRKVGSKTIQVLKITSLAETKNCQVIFIPKAQSNKIASIKTAIGNQSTLLVAEKEGSIASGSTIEFLIKDNKLKFKIDEERAKQHNLEVSRSLIDMAV